MNIPSGFSRKVAIDFEYGSDANVPEPRCFSAYDIDEKKMYHAWIGTQEERDTWKDFFKDSLMITFFGNAEIHCMLVMGWTLPKELIDYYSECRYLTNGLYFGDRGLLDFCSLYNIEGCSKSFKDTNRQLALRGGVYTNKEKEDLLKYNDVDALLTWRLHETLQSKIDWECARFRGRFVTACGMMEWRGIPVDVIGLKKLYANPEKLKKLLIERGDKHHVYVDTEFNHERFDSLIDEMGIPWERTPSKKQYKTLDSYFEEKSELYPEIKEIYDLQKDVKSIRPGSLLLGSDGRVRTFISQYASLTARSQPKSSEFILLLSKWLRCYIRPPEGMGLSYIDYCGAEIGIAGYLSGDRRMISAYQSGDPHLFLGKSLGIIPPDGQKKDYPREREICKGLFFKVNYGGGKKAVASGLHISENEAEQLLRWYQMYFETFHKWRICFVKQCRLDGKTDNGLWRFFVDNKVSHRTLYDYPMQTMCSLILQTAIVLCCERGVEVLAPLHDALLVQGSIEEIEKKTRVAEQCMIDASYLFLGEKLRVESEIYKYPSSFICEEGKERYDFINSLVNECIS